MEKYDVVVIGAGPAGSVASKIIAEGGYKVLLLEKRQEIGRPVRCAEGVSKKWLDKYTGIKDRWISSEIQGALLKSWSGQKALMEYKQVDKGFIIDRAVFDFDLARESANSGTVVRTKNSAVDIKKLDDHYEIFIKGLKNYKVKTKLIVAADGIEGKIPSLLGINNQLKPNDVEYCLNYQLDNVDIKSNYIEMIGGNTLAPGGYVWIFPKGERSANVGLGVLATRSTKDKNAKYYLDKFVEKRFKNKPITKVVAGAVTVSKPLKKMVGDGFMIVGDSARLTNPLTGAGIGNALESGFLAGKRAVEALDNSDISEKFLKEYQKNIMNGIGKTSKYFYKIKEAFVKFDDKEIDNMIKMLSEIKPDDLNLGKLLKIAFKNNKEIISLLKKMFF